MAGKNSRIYGFYSCRNPAQSGIAGVFVSVDLMEESIRLAYSFVYYLSKEGVETKLVISGDEKYCMEGTGRTQIAAARRALALISYEHPLSKGEDFVIRECEKIRREQHVILISAAGKSQCKKQFLICCTGTNL